MKLEEIRESAQRQMPDKRWQHVLGVTDTAILLAKRFGGDPAKAELAALLHDYCKAWPIGRQKDVLIESGTAGDLFEYDKELWHAHAGAEVARRELAVTDEEVLDAVRYHTSGRVGMTLLDKIVCLADYIEPGRDFPDVHNIRRIAEYSLEKALVAGFDSTIRFLLEKGKKVYPLTILARNALIAEIETEQEKGD